MYIGFNLSYIAQWGILLDKHLDFDNKKPFFEHDKPK